MSHLENLFELDFGIKICKEDFLSVARIEYYEMASVYVRFGIMYIVSYCHAK